ncbi:MAG: hypothetical protein OEZ01_16565 [Candidatus Heimdallarchaeota archaeon]|nr:hypothetical protein [Candidatus Heimdallarchaeota archaeon]
MYDKFIEIYSIFWYQVIILMFLVYGMLFSFAFYYKKGFMSAKVSRTSAHILMGITLVFLSEHTFAIIVFSIGMINGTHHLLTKPKYLEDVLNKKSSWGVWIYSYTLAILTIIALPQGNFLAFQLAMIVLSISDPIAMIVGSKFPIKSAGKYNKSIGGSLAFLISAIISMVIILYLHQILNTTSITLIILLAFMGMIVEFISVKGTDNATIPFVIYIPALFLF